MDYLSKLSYLLQTCGSGKWDNCVNVFLRRYSLSICLRDCIRAFRNMEVTSQGIPSVKRFKIYREIQLLGNLQSDILAEIMMTEFHMGATIYSTLSLVVILKLSCESKNGIIVVLCSYIECICATGILFVIGERAGVWPDSVLMLIQLNKLKGQQFGRMSRFERLS